MLNRLSSVLQSAADALAPPPPPLEDLKYHWKMVMRFYAQRTIQSKCPIEETNIPAHLEQLLRTLISEDSSTKNVNAECPCTAAGPCLEFLLQHHLLELLVSLARADSPPGMRRYLLGYLRRLVGSISPHLLTLASIHLPLLRIITVCSQSKASPTEAEEIEFLLALCKIIHRHPYLSIIFNKETKVNKQSGPSSSVSSSNQIQNDINETPLVFSTPTVQESSQILTDSSRNNGFEKMNLCPIEQNGTAAYVTDLHDPSSASVEILQRTESNLAVGIVKVSVDMGENEQIEGIHSNDGQKIVSAISDEKERLANSAVGKDNEKGIEFASGKQNSSATSGRLEPVNSDDLLDSKKGRSHPNEENICGQSQTTSGSCTPEPFPCEDFPESEGGEGRLPLLDAVLGYINSVDSVTKLHVCEALLMLVSVADETLSNSIARTSNLGLVMAEKLISSFQEVPPDTEPDHFEDIPQNWGPKTSQIWLEQHGFPGSRLIASFVSWLNFCDQLTVESPIEISESVAGAVRALFFEIELESELRTGDEVRKQLITNIICLCLRHVTSNILLSELNIWLMGEPSEDPDPSKDTSLKQITLNNCLHSDNRLSLNSMRLFELLLENCDEHVLNCLVLRYLKSRAYCDALSRQNKPCMDSWSDEEDAREEVKSNLCPDPSPISSRTFAPHNIHKIIDSFLQLLPNSLRSATDYHESGYHQYIAEAQRQYSLNIQVCTPMGWGTEACFPVDGCSAEDTSPSSQQFNEGPFLHMIFTRLRGLPKQPYEMNLQLTALVSRLAMLPHPHLHEFLLNPLVPIVPGTTTLYSTLQEVARELQAALASFPNSKKMLVKTRQELLGDVSHQHDFPEESGCLYESVVVLEEFCKELAAIVYVKYHHSS